MLFPEKMSAVPQPRRADLWREYRTLCTALSLQVKLRREGRTATEDELSLREAAGKANGILAEFGMAPSFFPEDADFLEKLLETLSAARKSPRRPD